MLPWVGHMKKPHGAELSHASRGLLDPPAEKKHQPADKGASSLGSCEDVQPKSNSGQLQPHEWPQVRSQEESPNWAQLRLLTQRIMSKQEKFYVAKFWNCYVAISNWYGGENRQVLLLLNVNFIEKWYLNKLDSDLLDSRSSEQEGTSEVIPLILFLLDILVMDSCFAIPMSWTALWELGSDFMLLSVSPESSELRSYISPQKIFVAFWVI